MELLGALYNKENLKEILPFVDGLVVYSSDFSSFMMKGFNLDEIKEIVSSTTKKVFLALDLMLEDEEEEAVTTFIESLTADNLYYIVSDLGVFQILKEHNLAHKTIFNPNTLITNEFDFNFYHKVGALGSALSLEITVLDQAKILEKKQGMAFMEVFGYHLMFHSKRKLVSMYQTFINDKTKLDNFNSYLIEQTRSDKYHIYESKRGTGLFRPYVLSYLKELNTLNKLDFAFISNMFIDFDSYLVVLKTYREYLDNKINLDEALDIINNLNYKFEDGFKYQDTIYQKEKICTR